TALEKPWEPGYVFTHTEYGAPYGGDPGRDQVAYTGDDLDYKIVINDIAEQHITIVGVYCPEGGMEDAMHSDAENNFRYMSYVTGGAYVLSNSAGNPSEITAQVVSIIEQMSIKNVGELSLQAGEETYRGWVASPDRYTDVPWPSGSVFNVAITPPAGTPEGDYSFPLNVVGDGVVLGTVAVTIHVPDVPTTSSIHVTSDPTGATILLDGVNTGIQTEHTFDGISPGPHTVNVTLAGYKIATEQTVNVVAGATAEASFTLEREQVAEPMEVSIDIKPGSCPNSLNVREKGVLTVAVLGSRDLKASEIDPESIVLTWGGGNEEVKPIRTSLGDVASASTKTCSCGFKSGRPDRKQDLILKFDSQDLLKKLGIENGEGCIRVTIAGTLKESDSETAGQVITGSDYLRVFDTGHGSCGKGSPKDDKGSCDDRGSCDHGDSWDKGDSCGGTGGSCDKGGYCDGGGSLDGEGPGDEGNPWDDEGPSSDHSRGNGRDSRD
ncbi:MAG: PEGA domain-containing protein, partial [Methanomicrobiales archaeon]|nr:PEGA domain-containing protein [Methanomicrobiales archaeon]